jgi:hypothetical protein
VSDELQIMWRTPKHVFAHRGNLIVQIRGEEYTLEAIDAQRTGLQLARAQARPGSPIAALLIVEEGAPPTAGEVARRQRELVRSFSADERIYISLVLEGVGAGVALKRTLARAIFRGPRRNISGTVREGARWLATSIGEPERVKEMVELVASLRS